VLVINGPKLSSAYHGKTEAKLRDVFREGIMRQTVAPQPVQPALQHVDTNVFMNNGCGGTKGYGAYPSRCAGTVDYQDYFKKFIGITGFNNPFYCS
jgi:hypothetical protein